MMSTNKRHAQRQAVRLWVYWNGGWVRLTVRRDCPVSLYRSESTDEGWSSEAEDYTLDTDDDGRDTVTNEGRHDGRDCDGRSSSGGTSVCYADRLAVDPAPIDGMGYTMMETAEMLARPVMRPEWREPESRSQRGWQRDYTAEAAGY